MRAISSVSRFLSFNGQNSVNKSYIYFSGSITSANIVAFLDLAALFLKNVFSSLFCGMGLFFWKKTELRKNCSIIFSFCMASGSRALLSLCVNCFL